MEFSPYIIAIVIAWVIAQGAKVVISAVQDHHPIDLRQLYRSGNMPSGHSATSIALLTLVGLKDGVDGALFGIATLFAVIVMYDALMVRRSSGEQGAAIQALIKEQGSKIKLPHAAKGHEPLEVAVGALLGVIVGLSVFFFTK